MARSKGIFDFSGKVGELVFTKRKGKNYVKKKSTKPVKLSEGTKKSGSDFGEASRTGAKIRKAFRPLFDKFGDHTLKNRLNTNLIAIINTIPNEFAGHKKMIDGNLSLLNEFPSYSERKLDTLLYSFPSFTIFPDHLQIVMAEGMSHRLFNQFRAATATVINLMVYNMDLNGKNDQIVPINPLVIPINREFNGAKLKAPLTLSGDRWVIVALGMYYLKNESRIGDKRARSGEIVFSAKVKDGEVVTFLEVEEVTIKIVEQPPGLDWDLL